MRVSLAEVLEFVCGRVVCWAEEEAGKVWGTRASRHVGWKSFSAAQFIGKGKEEDGWDRYLA